MLAKLWQSDAPEVKAALAALAAKSVLNVAQLPDGRVWCLPQAQQLALLQVCAPPSPALHGTQLPCYLRAAVPCARRTRFCAGCRRWNDGVIASVLFWPARLQAVCCDVAPHYHRLLLDAYCSSVLPRISEEPEGRPSSAGSGSGSDAGQQQQQQQQQQHWTQRPWQPQAPGAAAAAQRRQRMPQVPTQARLQDIPDDGYILINMGHHLTAAGRHKQVRPGWRPPGRATSTLLLLLLLRCVGAAQLVSLPKLSRVLPACLAVQLRELLLDPDWLRRKLVAAGTTAVVADFRRWAGLGPGASSRHLLLAQHTCWLNHVRGQQRSAPYQPKRDRWRTSRSRGGRWRVVGFCRLQQPPQPPRTRVCAPIHRAACFPMQVSAVRQLRGHQAGAGGAAAVGGAGAGVPARAGHAALPHDQPPGHRAAVGRAAGVQAVRRIRGLCSRLNSLVLSPPWLAWSPADAARSIPHPATPTLTHCLAPRPCPLPVPQAWLLDQRRRVYDDSRQALLSGLPRCLPPLTASLEQAGGLQRLALRGHTAGVTKVLLTPSGTDAVTASSDGTARVWDLDIGDCVLLLEGHAGPITDMAITSGAQHTAAAQHSAAQHSRQQRS